MNYNEELVNILIAKGYHICCAESCTGGMIASAIVDVPNASKVLNESFVTYADNSKIRILNVKKETIDKYGVVSEETALEMALGAATASGAEIAVSVTGLAGPAGADDTLSVGTVCFGFYINGRTVTACEHFGDIGRSKVRAESTLFAVKTLVRLLTVL